MGVVVFNEESLPFASADDALRWVERVLQICVSSQSCGYQMMVCGKALAGWQSVDLYPGCTLMEWGTAASRDWYRRFLSVAVDAYYSGPDEEENVAEVDVKLLGGTESFEPGRAAVWHSGPLISFPSSQTWSASSIAVEVSRLTDEAGIAVEARDLINVCGVRELKDEEAVLRREAASRISSGRDLLSGWPSLYPCLGICGSTSDQLRSWRYDAKIVDEVKESLEILNRFVSKWREGTEEAYSHDCMRRLGMRHAVSGESESVRNNPSLRSAREFFLPCGTKCFFEYHVKLPRFIRIHFLVDSQEPKRIWIGHIGPHLPLP